MAEPRSLGSTPAPTAPTYYSSSSSVLTTLSPIKKRRRSANDVDEAGQQHRQHRRPPLPTATDRLARPADRRRGGSDGDSTLALVGQTLEMLRAEVRSLRDENQRLRDQMTAMMTHQSTTSRVLATLQQQRAHQQQQQQHNRLHQPRPQSAQHLPPMALFRSSASSTMPAVALMEAMHEMPFLRDYPMLTGFAVPDFRFPVIVVEFASVFDHRPPVIIYANAAMCRLSEYCLDQLIGAPITALIVLQETQRKVLGPYITRQEPGSLGTVFHFHHLMRSKSGRLWRAVADDTQFFFGEHGSAKHTVISVTKWEAGHLGDGEELDHWAPLAEPSGAAPLPSSSSSSSSSSTSSPSPLQAISRRHQPPPPSPQAITTAAVAVDHHHHYPVTYSPATEEMLKTLLDSSTPRQSFSVSYSSTHATTSHSTSGSSSSSSSSSTPTSLSSSTSSTSSTGLPSSFIPLYLPDPHAS